MFIDVNGCPLDGLIGLVLPSSILHPHQFFFDGGNIVGWLWCVHCWIVAPSMVGCCTFIGSSVPSMETTK